MNTLNRSKHSGVTLVELIIGTVIIIIVMGGALSLFTTIGRGIVSNRLKNQASQKLHNVAEEIRVVGADPFTFSLLDNSRVFSTEGINPRISITKNFGTVESDTRTRLVTLTATWTDGVSKEKRESLTFRLSMSRGQVPGGRVKARVVNQLSPSDGIQDVKVTAAGQNLAVVGCFTDSNGECILEGVKLGNEATLYYDGWLSAYFGDPRTPNDPYLPVGQRNAERTFPVAIHGDNSLVSVDDVGMFPLAKVKGRVFLPNGDPARAEAISIKLWPRPGRTPFPNQGLAITDSEGMFKFNIVYPGEYMVRVAGSSVSFAGISEDDSVFHAPGDAAVDSSMQYLTFTPGGDHDLTLYTQRRADVRFNLTTIRSSNGSAQFQPEAGPGPDAFGFRLLPSQNRVNLPGGDQTFDLSKSLSYYDYAHYFAGNLFNRPPLIQSVQVPAPNFVLRSVAPWITSPKELDDQKIYINVEPAMEAKYPYTPAIIALGAGNSQANAGLYFFNNAGSSGMVAQFRFSGANPLSALLPMDGSGEMNFSVLAVDGMSNVQGRILLGGSSYPMPPLVSVVRVNTGMLKIETDRTTRFFPTRALSTNIVGGEHRYSFEDTVNLGGGPVTYKTLLPTVNNFVTRIEYEGLISKDTAPKLFHLTFQGIGKTAPNQANRAPMPLPSDNEMLEIRGQRYSVNIGLTPPTLTAIVDKDLVASGSLDLPTPLLAGQTYPGDQDINVVEHDRFLPYRATFINSTQWMKEPFMLIEHTYNAGLDRYGQTGAIELMSLMKTHVSVTVKDKVGGFPLVGASCSVQRSTTPVGSAMNQVPQMVSLTTIYSDEHGLCDFPEFSAYPENGHNLIVNVYTTGYRYFERKDYLYTRPSGATLEIPIVAEMEPNPSLEDTGP